MHTTSIQAYRSVQDMIPSHHARILKVMEQLPDQEGTAYYISLCLLDMNKHECGRRMGELERAGKVRNTGRSALTDRGRRAIIWKLVK